MAKLLQWIKNTSEKLFDPDRQVRVDQLSTHLRQELRARGKSFFLGDVLAPVHYVATDLEPAKEDAYRTILNRGWQDGMLNKEEQQMAAWVASALQLSPNRVAQINTDFAKHYFAQALALAMQDGVLDAAEEAHLQAISASVGMSMAQFLRHFFRDQGEAFLRGIFLACVADGVITQQEWNFLLATTQRFGLQPVEMLATIQPQARQFVEHVLADSKSDGRITTSEEQTLYWLLQNLGLPYEFHQYVHGEINLLKTLTEIESGRLPSLSRPKGFETKSGEIIHFCDYAVWRHTRLLKNGMTHNDHDGLLTITDNRLVFSAHEKSQSFRFRSILHHEGNARAIYVQVEGKPIQTFLLAERSPLPYAILRNAVAMANQTKLVKTDGRNTRHIERDVRQRVWQRYGGQCAECGATDYLEYDHIIPVARGGSNSDNNVQLLCRRCNLKKSDNI